MKTCATCGDGPLPSNYYTFCEACQRQRVTDRKRRANVMKRVAPNHVEGELARVEAECDRRKAVHEQRLQRYEAHVAGQTPPRPPIEIR